MRHVLRLAQGPAREERRLLRINIHSDANAKNNSVHDGKTTIVTDKEVLTHLEHGLWQRNLDDEISFYAWKYVAFSILPIFPSVVQSIIDVMSVTYTMVNDSCFGFNMEESLHKLYNSPSSISSSTTSVIDTLSDKEASFYHDSVPSRLSNGLSLSSQLKTWISSLITQMLGLVNVLLICTILKIPLPNSIMEIIILIKISMEIYLRL